MRQNINMILINVNNESTRFFDICETVLISIDSITISIPIFVMKRSDHELLLKRFFQRAARTSFININNKLFKRILHFLNEKKRMNFLKVFAEYVSNKKNQCSQ